MNVKNRACLKNSDWAYSTTNAQKSVTLLMLALSNRSKFLEFSIFYRILTQY